MKPADFPLDDPLVPEPLLLFLRFEELVLDQSRTMLFLVDLFAGALSARFQLAHAALEGGDTSAHPTQLILTGRDCLRSTPEQLRAPELAELAQGVADLVQQAVLVALARESLQLRIEYPQLADQGIDRLLRRAELRDERLLILQGLSVRRLLILRRPLLLQRRLILRCFRIHGLTLR